MISTRSCTLLSFILLMVVMGCENPGNVELDASDNEVEIKTIDTLTVQSSTIFVDTVNTQEAPQVLSGAYTDEYLGQVQATGFFKLSLPTTFSVSSNARYDSLTLRIEPSYYYGEADQRQKISVHRVTEEIEPEDDKDPLYNSDRFVYQPSPLGERTFIPDATDSLEISMPDQLGQQLFEAALNGEEITDEDYEFQKFLKGLALVGHSDTHTAVTGFDTDSTGDIELRLYYRDLQHGVMEEEYFSFLLEPGSSFSYITSQKPSPLDQLTKPNDALPSSATEDRTYVQNGIGLVTRLEFPTLDRLFNVVKQNYLLVSAELYIFPIAYSYGEETPLPQTLQLSVADEQNRIVGYITDAAGNIQTSSPTVDKEFNKNTYYYFDVTSFIQNELDTDAYTGYGLLITPPDDDYRSNIDRLALGSHQNKEFGMYLQLILSELNL